ncbi:MAG TPA: SDR family oxidoreductase [Stellaceae bacterium]|nr:SDR family oxidoreductase [Stellaceae bacterium]
MPEVVVITGATAGVGRATARLFARRGARIGLIARGRDGLDGAAVEVEAAGGQALAIPADVADADAVEAAAAAVERKFGPIDIWVNAAMTTIFAPLHEITAEEFRRATEVTYLGFVHGTMAALKRMRPRNKGVIVQVGSALSYRAIPLQSAYCGAKFAIRGFTDSLRSELIHDGVKVHLTMVQMPGLNTPQFEWCRNKLPRRPQPVPPIFEPELAARAIWFAAHSRRREVWVGGSTVQAILGTMLAPGLLDRLLARKAYGGQMSRELADPAAPDNLFAPVAGDHGAHGPYGGRARSRSLELWVSRHRGAIMACAAGLLAFLVSGAAARPARPRLS